MKNFNIENIKKILKSDYEFKGKVDNVCFDNIKPILSADKNSLVWVSEKLENINQTIKISKSRLIIIHKDHSIKASLLNGRVFIKTSDPKRAIIKIINNLFVKEKKHKIAESSKISSNAIIGCETFIGSNTIIDDCIIGDNCFVDSLCKIHDDVNIGNYVSIHSGAIIGSDGFGFMLNDKREYEKFPHIGGVIIENNVEIGANVCIDKGTLGDTIIRDGVKIANLVKIAHNVIIGRNTIICSMVNISGSSEIGFNAWIAPGVTIRNGIRVGSNSKIGLGSVVLENVPDNEIWIGNPAKKFIDKDNIK